MERYHYPGTLHSLLKAHAQMQILQTPPLFAFTFPQNPKPHLHNPHLSWRPLLPQTLISPSAIAAPNFRPRCFSSDEFPVDETFLESFAPKDKETEDEARRRNWIERGWAPWDEILSYEGDFARKSLNEGEEVPLKNPDSLEAYRMMSPKYREEKRKEMGLTEEEWARKRCEIKGEKPDPLSTMWLGPLVIQLVPPRDWPPRGWEVDREELEFIRGAHKMQAKRVDLGNLEDVENRVNTDTSDMNLERYKVFLKQYKEWVSANKDRLEKESYEYDQDYHPGRRKRGKDYVEGMYELPFYYPGQICEGTVTTLHLYQGAFVDIGGVYEGWVPIRGNDWYWLRHHIKVGMHVIVEILAKRDPYRFRFPIEMRFVHPNIDHLIFNKFEFPPIFHRDADFSPDEILRDAGRPLTPRKRLKSKPEKTTLLSNHPYVEKLWQIHVAEQMIVDDFELNPQKYEGQKLSELSDDEDFDEDHSVQYTTTPFQETTIPKVIMKTSVKELDLDSALAERKIHNKLRTEAKERGEEYKIDKLNRNIEMDEYDLMHFRRSLEEREALIRDISCRQALGLPVEEPGRYKDESFFAKEQKYDPKNPLYKYDYWGEPRNSEKRKILGAYMDHHRSIIGKSKPWYKSSYQRAITHTRQEEETDQSSDDDDDEDDDKDEIDIDYINTFLGNASPKTLKKLTIGGLDSKMEDDDMFVD